MFCRFENRRFAVVVDSENFRSSNVKSKHILRSGNPLTHLVSYIHFDVYRSYSLQSSKICCAKYCEWSKYFDTKIWRTIVSIYLQYYMLKNLFSYTLLFIVRICHSFLEYIMRNISNDRNISKQVYKGDHIEENIDLYSILCVETFIVYHAYSYQFSRI